MFRSFITLIFVATLSGMTGTGLGILIAPAEGAQTRQHLSVFMNEQGGTLMEGLDRGRRALGYALEFVTSRVRPNENTG